MWLISLWRPSKSSTLSQAETLGRGVSVVIDAVGMESTRVSSIALLEPGGTALWIGMHQREATIPAFDMVTEEKRVQGLFAYNNAEFAVAAQLICSGRIRPAVETNSLPLAEGAKAFNRLLDGSSDPEKVVLVGESIG